MRNKAETCSCGTRHDEWDPALGGDRYAYEPAVHYCRGHDVLAQAQEEVPKDDKGRPLPGFMPYLKRVRRLQRSPRTAISSTTATTTVAADQPHRMV